MKFIFIYFIISAIGVFIFYEMLVHKNWPTIDEDEILEQQNQKKNENKT